MKPNVFRGALIASLIVVAYGLLFHNYHNIPHDWQAAVMWLPLYISPIWGLAGASWLSEREDKNGNN